MCLPMYLVSHVRTVPTESRKKKKDVGLPGPRVTGSYETPPWMLSTEH